MANELKPITDLTLTTGADGNDLLVIVADPAGVAVTKRITRADFLGGTNIVQVVGTTESQTLTNKILTSPTINTPIINTPTINTPTITNPTIGLTSSSLNIGTGTAKISAASTTTRIAIDGGAVSLEINNTPEIFYSHATPTISLYNASNRTLLITNSGGGQANLNVQNNIVLSGTITGATNIPTLTGVETLTNKIISYNSNTISNIPDGMNKNGIINGSMSVWQRGTTFTTPNDDTYGPDRWNFLVDGNGAWTFARDTVVPTGNFKYSLKCTNVTQNKQCGIVTFFENIDAVKYQGKTASISFYAGTTSSEIANLRATVLSWTSTADTITSDVVGTWAGNGTDPTWATNWTSEIAGSNKALTGSWQQFTINNIAIDTASITNLAVVIWVDDTTITAGDKFWITGIQLENAVAAGAFSPRPYQHELALCQRYCYSVVTATNGRIAFGSAASTTVAYCMLPLPVTMRTSSFVLTATSADWALDDGANAAVDVTSLALVGDVYNTPNAAFLNATVASGLTQYRPYHLEADGSARTIIISGDL